MVNRIGFDIDGVICRDRLAKLSHINWLFKLIYFLTAIPQIRWLYNAHLRRLNYDVKRVIDLNFSAGYEIFIVSGNYIRTQSELEKWLFRHKINYHNIRLYPGFSSGLTIAAWKAQVINKHKIDLFFDDTPSIVDFLRKNTSASIVQYQEYKK